METVTGVAGDTISKIVVDPVIQLLKDVIHKEENTQILQTDLKRMENLVLDISTIFQDQQKAPPQTVTDWLQRLQISLKEAEDLLHRSSLPQRCLGCLMCSPVRLPTQIREWKVNFDNLFQGLQNDFSILVNAQHIVKLAPQKALLQDVPASGFVGSGINSAQQQVETWLGETDHVRIIRVHGMGGVGKTSLLKVLYNAIKVSNVFQHVIWVTVSADYKPLDLQARIAEAINLELPSNSDIDRRKMLLSANLKEKKFLLVLDDVWQPLNLQELGVAFDEHIESKVLFSTRRRDLILGTMRVDRSIEIQPLSADEAWMLFQRIAFNDDADSVSMDIIERAREIAEECKGLPLAITVIAASMIGKTSVDEWVFSLETMKSADPCFPDTHPRVDPELYQRLRCSYDALPSLDVKNCFLYCAMYPEDWEIPARSLVQMWIAEGFVRSKQGSHLLDMAIGHSYVNLLVDRCLFQNASNYEDIDHPWVVADWQRIRVHDVIRDMAIYIGEKEENCVFKAGQQLQDFPEIHNESCKRISVFRNDIENLPNEFTRSKLVSLFLSNNAIKEFPSGFLVSLTSLKVLDLCNIETNSIPSSVGQLKKLEYLSLSDSNIRDLPEEICDLSSLQFLDLSGCRWLLSLPSKIGELKTLKYLNLRSCYDLTLILHEISHLTSLSTLDAVEVELSVMESESEETSLWSLKSLRNLTMLRIGVDVDVQEGMTSAGIKVGIMGAWLEMRHLRLDFTEGDYVMDDLPEDMQKMSKLQSFIMYDYNGLTLPGYSCNFKHLEYLELNRCSHIKDISALEQLPNLKHLEVFDLPNLMEWGIRNSRSGFLRLEELVLLDLKNLERIVGPSNNAAWNESILPKLRVLKISGCPSLQRLPIGMEKLVSLSTLVGEENWWQKLKWEDDNMKSYLQNIFVRWE